MERRLSVIVFQKKGTQDVKPPPRVRRLDRVDAVSRDLFVERPPPAMDVAAIRSIAAAGRASANQAVDVEEIPFGVELELEGFDLDGAAEFVNRLPKWDVHPKLHRWKLDEDHSLSSGGEAISPPMTLKGGQAEEQIRQVLARLKSLGGKATRNCGLHIHVDKSVLGDEGLANLMKISLEQERLLFRLSQNGNKTHRGTIEGNGFRHGTPYYYCKPLNPSLRDPFSLLHAASVNQFRNALYTAIPDTKGKRPRLPAVDSDKPFRPDRRDPVRYFGVNFNSYWYRGTIEFRLFDASDDPDQVITTLKLVLHTIKAAAEGNYDYLRPIPLRVKRDMGDGIPRESYEYFMSKVITDPALKKGLEETFVRSGGKVTDDEPVRDPMVLTAATMLTQGFEFHCEGNAIKSAFEIASQIGRRPIEVVPPGGSTRIASIASAEDLDTLTQFLSRETANRIQSLAKTLASQGYVLCDGSKTGSKDVDLRQLILSGRASIRPSEGKSKQGIVAPDLEFIEAFAGMSPAQKQCFESVQLLEKKGYGVRSSQDKRGVSVHDILRIAADRAPQIWVCAPGQSVWYAVEGGAPFRTLMAAELHRDDDLSADAQLRCRMGDVLLGKGYGFLDARNQEMKTRGAFAVADRVYLSVPSAVFKSRESGWIRPMASVQTPTSRVEFNLSDLQNVYHWERGERDKMDPKVRHAFECKEAMQAAGLGVTNGADDTRVSGPAHLLASLKSGRAIRVRDALGSSTDVQNIDQFIEQTSVAMEVAKQLGEMKACLVEKGCQFVAMSGARVVLNVAGLNDKVALGMDALKNLFQLARGNEDQIDAQSRAALQRAAALRSAGLSVHLPTQAKDHPLEGIALLARLEAGLPIRVSDPTGRGVDVMGTARLVEVADARLKTLDDLTDEQRATMHDLQAMIDAEHLVVQAPSSTESVLQPVRDASHIPWILSDKQPLLISGTAEFKQVAAAQLHPYACEINDWGALRNIVETEKRSGAAASSPAATQMLAQFDRLRGNGVTFYHVTPIGGGLFKRSVYVPMSLTSSLLDKVEKEGVHAALPGWLVWNYFPRKSVTIRGQADLQRLAARYPAPPSAA